MAESTCNENPLPPLGDGGKASDDLAVVESPVKRTKLSDAEQDSAASASSGGCDVEVVKRDEFEFLDGVTRLATLEAGKCISTSLPVYFRTNDKLRST